MTAEEKAVYQRIEDCERRGAFDEHTSPPDLSLSRPVGPRYDYLKKGPVNALIRKIADKLAKPKEDAIVDGMFRTEIVGLENLQAVPNAVVVSNHVHMFDCLIIRRAFQRKNLYVMAADFNNRGDGLGFLMRWNGMLPLNPTITGMKRLNKAIAEILQREKGYVLIYPEASEWLYYRKPRPFKDGAFWYAAKNRVPVLPLFLTFTDEEPLDEDGRPFQKATLHILPAIASDPNTSVREETLRLRSAAFEAMREKYESFYGVKLEYSCDGEKEKKTV